MSDRNVRQIDEVFIGIVSKMGSPDVTWQGTFRFDPVEGYVGKLMSPILRLTPGTYDIMDVFASPADLDRDLLWCLLNGDRPGTIFWPKVGLTSTTPTGSRIVPATFPTLIQGCHIGDYEKPIVKVVLCSAMLAPLFNVETFKGSVQLDHPRQISITANSDSNVFFLVPTSAPSG
jgi:hypothetical protein